MKESLFLSLLRKGQDSAKHNLLLFFLSLLAFCSDAAVFSRQTRPAPDSLTATEFARLVRDFSEEGGYFLSDNFTSNETSYLHITDRLKQFGTTGGAYIGVGPEQNFTYIAKLRPQIAFIIDIRRQAILQHLMYKAIFHQSPTRAEFLARLLSRPLLKDKVPAAQASGVELMEYFSRVTPSEQAYTENLAAIKKLIQEEFQMPLSEGDQSSLEYVYKTFRTEGLNIAFRLEDNYWGGYFPTLKEIILQTDLKGKPGSFLASADDYEYVREMHRKNLIIPVVGNFAGAKALAAIGDYLRKRGYTVTAYYTSNVEQYLFDGSAFENFAVNIGKLPLTEKSLFIRAVFRMRYSHPAQQPAHLSVTLLQPMKAFLKEFEAGRYQTYRDLIYTSHIVPETPSKAEPQR